jgi:hypothetical protein
MQEKKKQTHTLANSAREYATESVETALLTGRLHAGHQHHQRAIGITELDALRTLQGESGQFRQRNIKFQEKNNKKQTNNKQTNKQTNKQQQQQA